MCTYGRASQPFVLSNVPIVVKQHLRVMKRANGEELRGSTSHSSQKYTYK